jgi:hypothetical protein
MLIIMSFTLALNGSNLTILNEVNPITFMIRVQQLVLLENQLHQIQRP